jgi:hypothetical protein
VASASASLLHNLLVLIIANAAICSTHHASAQPAPAVASLKLPEAPSVGDAKTSRPRRWLPAVCLTQTPNDYRQYPRSSTAQLRARLEFRGPVFASKSPGRPLAVRHGTNAFGVKTLSGTRSGGKPSWCPAVGMRPGSGNSHIADSGRRNLRRNSQTSSATWQTSLRLRPAALVGEHRRYQPLERRQPGPGAGCQKELQQRPQDVEAGA